SVVRLLHALTIFVCLFTSYWAIFTSCCAHTASAPDMHSPNAGLDEGSSESQHGGGLLSQEGPKTPKSHWTWHSVTALVHLRVARITFWAKLAPALANCFWQWATSEMSGGMSAVARPTPSRRATIRIMARIDIGSPLAAARGDVSVPGALVPRAGRSWQ